MGMLKPGTAYTYEREGSTVYAREVGSDPSNRIPVGWDYCTAEEKAFRDSIHSEDEESRKWQSKMLEDFYLENEWRDIIRSSKNNMILQEALERVKILYHLSKKDAK